MSQFCVSANPDPTGASMLAARRALGLRPVEGPNRLLIDAGTFRQQRIDSFKNIVEGSGSCQVILLRAGHRRTLRVGRQGKDDGGSDLMASMVEFGKSAACRGGNQYQGSVLPLRRTDASRTVGGRTYQVNALGVGSQHRRGIRTDHAGEPESQAVMEAPLQEARCREFMSRPSSYGLVTTLSS